MLGFEWQPVISQSACADETQQSFNHQISLTVQNHFLSTASPTKEARMITQEWERKRASKSFQAQMVAAMPYVCLGLDLNWPHQLHLPGFNRQRRRQLKGVSDSYLGLTSDLTCPRPSTVDNHGKIATMHLVVTGSYLEMISKQVTRWFTPSQPLRLY